MKKTVSLKKITIATSTTAQKVYPIVSYDENKKEHKTVAIKLTRNQAIELATNLLIGAKEWEDMHLTAFRGKNSINVTVTSQQVQEDGIE